MITTSLTEDSHLFKFVQTHDNAHSNDSKGQLDFRKIEHTTKISNIGRPRKTLTLFDLIHHKAVKAIKVKLTFITFTTSNMC